MASIYSVIRPLVFSLDAEKAHGLTLMGLKSGLFPGGRNPDPDSLAVELFGRRFANPVGIAAGFDKNGEIVRPLFRLGFGFVEAGTVTPKPQAGNPRPRIFRLKEDAAVINRCSFNNDGHLAVRERLRAAREKGLDGPLGVNIGANRTSDDPGGDYVTGLQRFAGLADYYAVNISSPNTPGLRALQGRDALNQLLNRVTSARAKLDAAAPVLLKIAPDLSAEARQDIAALAIAHGIDGIIISNTTTARPARLKSAGKEESGGLSGRPLFAPSTEILGDIYRLTHGRIPLIGVGGIFSGDDAYRKIRAGASLLQLYTALVYEGPGLVERIKADLAAKLKADGFATVGEAVGADNR